MFGDGKIFILKVEETWTVSSSSKDELRMKQVIAIIRMNMMNATKQALIEAGFPAFTARKVVGRGKGNVDLRVIKARKPTRRRRLPGSEMTAPCSSPGA